MKKNIKIKMSSDENTTMYGNPLAEFLMFLVDFFVFSGRAIYFLLETFILTILPNRYRKMKVSFEILHRSTCCLSIDLKKVLLLVYLCECVCALSHQINVQLVFISYFKCVFKSHLKCKNRWILQTKYNCCCWARCC